MDDPVALLLRQHDELLARLATASERFATMTAGLVELAAYLDSEVVGHFALEERALFPVVSRYADAGPGTLTLLRDEHAAARCQLAELGEALRSGDVAEQVRIAAGIIDHLRAHVAKEDAMLLAVAALALDAADREEIVRLARECS